MARLDLPPGQIDVGVMALLRGEVPAPIGEVERSRKFLKRNSFLRWCSSDNGGVGGVLTV